MTGRTRLSWVTALTITSLLLGAGTLNALADNNGGKGHGGGSGKVEHQDKQQRAEVHHDVQSSKHAEQQATVNDNDRRGPDRGSDRDDDDDLVTPPARVTDEVRPGKGCGDENHVHLRHHECDDKFQDDNEDDDQMEVEDD